MRMEVCYMFNLFKKNKAKECDIHVHVPARPDWETVVEIMFDQKLESFADEVVNVIYSKDKSMRYVIIKDENSIFTYVLEALHMFDDDEWKYISEQPNALPAIWDPYYKQWGFSHFGSEEDLMKELIHEPEYKQFFC